MTNSTRSGKTIVLVLLLGALLTLGACNRDGTAGRVNGTTRGDGAPTADTLYINGVIWTGVGATPDATAMAVRSGEIVYVGSPASDGDEVPTPPVDAKRTVDLEGRFVMAGFTDNHVHFLDGGAALASVELRDADTRDVFVQRIADYSKTLTPGRWVLNGNWDHELWGGELPRKDWIDADTGDTPVFVMRLDGHMALANSAALKLAGVTAKTVSPDGGEIVRDAKGQPTGVLKDNAMDLVFAVVPTPSDEELLEDFRLAQDHALSLGLTQVHHMSAPGAASGLTTFRMARERGEMKIRIYSFAALAEWEAARDLIAKEGKGDDVLRWGGVKGFVDGSLGSTTAWFYQPYDDARATSGFPVTDPATLRQLIESADGAALHVAIHAIGDRAIDELIEDFRAAAGDEVAARRFRIEHFQHPTRAAISAAAASGIIASMQPTHAIDDGRWAEKRIGPERIKTTYAFRSILDAGGILTFGSDWPVASLSPLEGVYAAVTRRTTDGLNPGGWQPQEKITVKEALTAYTVSNAFSGFEEAKSGTLEVGKRADFVVLSEDPRTIDPVDLRSIGVLETVIGGETVFSSSAATAVPSSSTDHDTKEGRPVDH